jgi:hypothetical protein
MNDPGTIWFIRQYIPCKIDQGCQITLFLGHFCHFAQGRLLHPLAAGDHTERQSPAALAIPVDQEDLLPVPVSSP